MQLDSSLGKLCDLLRGHDMLLLSDSEIVSPTLLTRDAKQILGDRNFLLDVSICAVDCVQAELKLCWSIETMIQKSGLIG